jgi:hypothetical protein
MVECVPASAGHGWKDDHKVLDDEVRRIFVSLTG